MNRKIGMGCDPELFVVSGGKVKPSSEVIPKLEKDPFMSKETVIEDGIQVELNPSPNQCRDSLANNIANAVRRLKTALGSDDISSKVTVEIDKEDFDSIPCSDKMFGCKPSFNVHEGVSQIKVDPMTYNKRSAGGHIHLSPYKDYYEGEGMWGFSDDMSKIKDVIFDPERLVSVLDVIVGNTCVLLDRDEGNIERRKNYGRAGEYRTPEYGLEYRTLSNFWMLHPILFYYVFGLAREAVNITADGLDKELMELVDMDDIRKAINENDAELARKNLEKYRPFLEKIASNKSDNYVVTSKEDFKLFNEIVEVGIYNLFKDDIIGNWEYVFGWENYKHYLYDNMRPEHRELIERTLKTKLPCQKK